MTYEIMLLHNCSKQIYQGIHFQYGFLNLCHGFDPKIFFKINPQHLVYFLLIYPVIFYILGQLCLCVLYSKTDLLLKLYSEFLVVAPASCTFSTALVISAFKASVSSADTEAATGTTVNTQETQG